MSAERDLMFQAERLVRIGECADISQAVEVVCKRFPKVYLAYMAERQADQRRREQPGQSTAVRKIVPPTPRSQGMPGTPHAGYNSFDALVDAERTRYPDLSQADAEARVAQRPGGKAALAAKEAQARFMRG